MFLFQRIIVFAVLMTGLGLGGFTAPCGLAATEPVLVQGKGFKISEKDLEARLQALPPRTRELFASEKGRDHFLRELVRIEVLAREAKAKNLDKTPAFQAQIAQITKTLLAAEYTNSMIQPLTVTEAEAQKYYQEHAAELKEPERIKAPFIFVSVPKRSSPQTWKEKEALAQEIQRKAKDGADFMKLADQYSDAEERESDYFARGRLGPDIEDGVFNLKVGDISPVLKTSAGFLIFKLEERVPEKNLTFEQAREQVKQEALKQKKQQVFAELEKKLFDKYQVVFTSAAASANPGKSGPEGSSPGEVVTGKIIKAALTADPKEKEKLLGRILLQDPKGGQLALDVTPRTKLLKRTAKGTQPAVPADLKEGLQVEAVAPGPLQQTYPPQGEAASITILAP